MERVNGNLKAAQTLLMDAMSLDSENSAVLMVRSTLVNVAVAVHFLMFFN
jgi:hypothetical protein